LREKDRSVAVLKRPLRIDSINSKDEKKNDLRAWWLNRWKKSTKKGNYRNERTRDLPSMSIPSIDNIASKIKQINIFHLCNKISGMTKKLKLTKNFISKIHFYIEKKNITLSRFFLVYLLKCS